MDEGPEIDHRQFSRGALRHSHLLAKGDMGRVEGLISHAASGTGSPQLVATETLTIGRSPDRARVLVSTVE